MDPKHRRCLEITKKSLLLDNLLAHKVLPYLVKREVITRGQKADIDSLATERLQRVKLLGLLPSCGSKAFVAFLEALKATKQLRLYEALQKDTGISTYKN